MANNDQGILPGADEASLLASDLAVSRRAFGEMRAAISEWAKAIAEALQPFLKRWQTLIGGVGSGYCWRIS